MENTGIVGLVCDLSEFVALTVHVYTLLLFGPRREIYIVKPSQIERKLVCLFDLIL